MPKLKTHKGIARRIKITGTGKVLRWRTGRRHLLSSKTAARKRRMRRPTGLTRSAEKTLKRLLT